MFGAVKKAKDLHSWFKFASDIIGYLGWTAFVSGVITSIGGGIWAVIKGIPVPIAIMVAYCTFVCGAYLMMLPVALRALSGRIEGAAPKKKIVPNYAAWKHLDAYELQDASKLWCDVDPNSSKTSDSIAWYEVFKAKIIKKEFEIVPRNASTRDYEYSEPNEFTKIRKLSLVKFASDNNYDPIFLRF